MKNSNTKNRSVLIINAQRNGLGVVRSLSASGYRIYVADHDPFAAGFLSHLPAGRFWVPNPMSHERQFLNSLLRIARKVGHKDRLFLVPMNDEYVVLFAKWWNLLAAWFIPLFETRPEYLRIALQKNRTYDVARSVGVPTPVEFTDSEVTSLDSKMLPVIVKPVARRDPSIAGEAPFRIRYCRTVHEVMLAKAECEAARFPFVVQRYIPGADDQLYTAGVAAWCGQLVGCFTGRKLRQFPPRTGECSFGEVISEPLLVEYAISLVRALNFSGIAQIEFKYYAGTFYLIEINPRSWSWNSLASHAGVNLPVLLCRAAEGVIDPLKTNSRKRGYWHMLDTDLEYNFLRNRNETLANIFRDCFRSSCHAYFDFSDPLPALSPVLKGIARFGIFFKKRLNVAKRIRADFSPD